MKLGSLFAPVLPQPSNLRPFASLLRPFALPSEAFPHRAEEIGRIVEGVPQLSGEGNRMRRIVAGGGQAWLEEEPDLQPEGQWVVVQVAALPICGSDRHAFQGEKPNRHGGHEGVGVVVAAESGERVRAGYRVVLMDSN